MFVPSLIHHKASDLTCDSTVPDTLNKKRIEKLDELREKFSLEMVPFKQSDKTTSFLGNHLDLILYRSVELLNYKVDHNPLYAQSRKKC
ncbi:MAG: hypothetical protein COB07_04635 [Sulfurovum sp.]|nr:MAG: hypothetical protein COB07_04635 [Sulfurovum sp.]